jgi:hypothetical protein
MRLKKTALLLGGLLALTSAALAASDEAKQYLTKHEVAQPTVDGVVVCHGFGCKFRTLVALRDSDIRRLRQILTKGRASATSEINAIAEAVAWFERRIGPHTGTNRRTPRAGPDQAGIRTEADCIDESVNTTALLLLLSELDLLRFHSVVEPGARGYLIDMRYPHATAVVENRLTGARWAIDPWTKQNGQRPDTLPLEVWMKGS